MKIYTRSGDEGTTGLLGGNRVSKADIRIETYGTLDELNAWLGLIADECPDQHQSAYVRSLQNDIFLMGSHLAAENQKGKSYLNDLRDGIIEEMEREIDDMTEVLPPLKNFILPGGEQRVSFVQISRTVCRRAERLVVHLHSVDPSVDQRIIRTLNRLSDYLFTLARYTSHILGVEEKPWISKT
ncbi:MAG: cob(I)yrinic acid a,c-diamide adenosyltransferase [Cryomorphaceae bacterium]|nr:cob(I)yrinic acid a,c-diamide adenosyltransferase [Cryomorphaceae bacterium]